MKRVKQLNQIHDIDRCPVFRQGNYKGVAIGGTTVGCIWDACLLRREIISMILTIGQDPENYRLWKDYFWLQIKSKCISDLTLLSVLEGLPEEGKDFYGILLGLPEEECEIFYSLVPQSIKYVEAAVDSSY